MGATQKTREPGRLEDWGSKLSDQRSIQSRLGSRAFYLWSGLLALLRSFCLCFQVLPKQLYVDISMGAPEIERFQSSLLSRRAGQNLFYSSSYNVWSKPQNIIIGERSSFCLIYSFVYGYPRNEKKRYARNLGDSWTQIYLPIEA